MEIREFLNRLRSVPQIWEWFTTLVGCLLLCCAKSCRMRWMISNNDNEEALSSPVITFRYYLSYLQSKHALSTYMYIEYNLTGNIYKRCPPLHCDLLLAHLQLHLSGISMNWYFILPLSHFLGILFILRQIQVVFYHDIWHSWCVPVCSKFSPKLSSHVASTDKEENAFLIFYPMFFFKNLLIL